MFLAVWNPLGGNVQSDQISYGQKFTTVNQDTCINNRISSQKYRQYDSWLNFFLNLRTQQLNKGSLLLSFFITKAPRLSL